MTLCSTIADKHTPKAFCGCASRNRDPDGHSGRHTVGYKRKSDEGGQVKDEDWDWCDRFYFAVDEAFPAEVLPDGHGLILADAWGGEILRDGPEAPLAAARRKALTLRAARVAAARLRGALDPGATGDI